MKQYTKCRGCKSRYIGCHSECVDYIAFRNERDKILELKLKEEKQYCECADYKLKGTYKMIRRQGQRTK